MSSIPTVQADANSSPIVDFSAQGKWMVEYILEDETDDSGTWDDNAVVTIERHLQLSGEDLSDDL